MHHEPPEWVGRVEGIEIRRRTRDGCLSGLRRLAGQDALLWVEVTPDVVGVSEAASILGWDRRRVATYVSRGAFPEPIEGGDHSFRVRGVKADDREIGAALAGTAAPFVRRIAGGR
jgi:hypothetical protein